MQEREWRAEPHLLQCRLNRSWIDSLWSLVIGLRIGYWYLVFGPWFYESKLGPYISNDLTNEWVFSHLGAKLYAQFIRQSDNQTIRQSDNQTIRQSDNQTIRQSDNQTIRQSDNQTIRQSDNQTIRQSDYKPTKYPNMAVHAVLVTSTPPSSFASRLKPRL